MRGTRSRVCVVVSWLVVYYFCSFMCLKCGISSLREGREEHEMLGRVLSDSETQTRPWCANPCGPTITQKPGAVCSRALWREILISIKNSVPSSDRCKVGRKL